MSGATFQPVSAAGVPTQAYLSLPPSQRAEPMLSAPVGPTSPTRPTNHPLLSPRYEPLPTSHLGALQLPGNPSHDVHSISTPDSNADAPQATPIGGVGISANQKNPRVCIVFQNDLKKNPRS